MLLAEIAQLVEHNLAKVGVASSSLVFRSEDARMVESVDTRDLKSLGHCGCAGSSPAPSTDVYRWLHEVQLAFFLYLCRQHQGAESRVGVRALMRLWTVASLGLSRNLVGICI